MIIAIREYANAKELQAGEVKFESDAQIQEKYEINEVRYYIMSNMDTNSIVWFSNSLSGAISGEIEITEIYKIINSVT